MEPRTITQSRGKVVGYLAITVCFVVGGVWMATHADRPNDVWFGWFSAAFFGLGLIVFPWMLIRPQVLRLNAKGFTLDGGLTRKPRRVLWRDIDSIFIYRGARGVKMIGYNYLPGRAPNTNAVRLARGFGAEGGLPKTWSISPDSLVDLLNQYRSQSLAGH